MAALTDAAPPSRRQQNRLWDSDAWSCPDPERCVRCDCAVLSPSTPAAGVVKFILDNQAAGYEDDDHEDSADEDGERWFMVGCRRPYQYEPLAQEDLDQEEVDEDDFGVFLLEENTTLVVADGEDERQQQQLKATTEIKKKKKKAESSNSDDSSSSSNSSSSSSSSSSSDNDDSSSSSNTSDSSDSSSSSNSSSSSSSSSSSDSSDSSTSSDSSSSDSSGDDSQKKKKNKKKTKKQKHHPSSGKSKERDSCSVGENIRRNKNPVLENSHTHLRATAEGNGNSDDYSDDDHQSSTDVPPKTSVFSVVMKVPQTTSSHVTVEDAVFKTHRDSGDELEHENSSRQRKKHHHKRDR